MRLSRKLSLPAAGLAALIACGPVAAAEPCTREDFAAAVDAAGASLRKLNSEAGPRFKAKLELLAKKRNWPSDGAEERGLDELQDERVGALDGEANDHLSKIDDLGRVEGTPDCAKLAELKAAGSELLAVMRAKSDYLLTKIDRELGIAPPAVAAARPEAVRASPPLAATKPAGKPAVAPWDTVTTHEPSREWAGPAPGPGAVLPPDAFVTADDGYTIDEIREATRGFFGTISTSLASVIEHAFATVGRPTAYVLGSEGGGAFLAGLRYGKGTLYLRNGGSQQVYWHGPSVGGDIGASGSRTLFLIYRLGGPEGLFRRFGGIDGSAYVVGGVGFTLLKGGDVIMAPIRSGVGLRLGASIGYVRFTPTPTWNPF
jgi:hypothetical protein